MQMPAKLRIRKAHGTCLQSINWNLKYIISRFVLQTRQCVSSSERRDQSHQVSEGEGEGGQLQGEDAAEEEESAAQLCILQERESEVVDHISVSWLPGLLHSSLLSGEKWHQSRIIEIGFKY